MIYDQGGDPVNDGNSGMGGMHMGGMDGVDIS